MMEDGSVNLQFAKRLPKIELHAHLSGSISRKCLHDVWLQKKSIDPDFDLEDPLLAIPPGKVDYNLTTFFPLFSSYIYKLCNDVSSIEYTTAAVLADFQSDNVVYLELRTTPRAIPDAGITKSTYIRTILSCIAQHNANPTNTLHANLILSIDRRHTPAEAHEIVDLALAYRPHGVVGIDLCGDPSVGDVSALTPAFRRANREGLKITVHFAEAPASATEEELWTLLGWQPDRLGHVIHVDRDSAIAREIVRRKLGLELCLSCNVRANMLVGGGGYPEHHFGWWRDLGVPIALGTDDVGVFCSELSEEYRVAAEHFGLGHDDVRKLCESAVDMIFGSDAERARLSTLYTSLEVEMRRGPSGTCQRC
ncbi:hypothetical protein W97_08991 [Coniosporium apollinis CBS 100218]|uniref:Adenosine deaminase domain-containing protein n=1 Tax=Coniosporium apollinis (strain CBS 100218) TaxID=1168221 RepID=R7Z6U0_CONA1|nr:uncharacterized protein W97_08991 [Coniosporium apollinis CBS 100218]EON69729.1 hypothetical protein W97_08991 [Coniosporium apollinis CBS 100218]